MKPYCNVLQPQFQEIETYYMAYDSFFRGFKTEDVKEELNTSKWYFDFSYLVIYHELFSDVFLK